MSWPVTTFFCTTCDFREGDVRTWGTKEYVLDSGVRIPVSSRIGWCQDCEGLAAVEVLSETRRCDDLAEAERELLALKYGPVRRWWQLHWFLVPTLWRRRVANWAYYACKVEDAKDALRLIGCRTEPPRCLACGGVQVTVPLVIDQSPWNDGSHPKRTGFIHPGCGGELWVVMNGTQIGLRPSVRRYTPEGDFIEKEYVEGYTVPRESYFDRRQAENARIRGLGDAERFSFAEWVRRHAD